MGGGNPQKRTEHCRLSGWSFVARNLKGLKKKKKAVLRMLWDQTGHKVMSPGEESSYCLTLDNFTVQGVVGNTGKPWWWVKEREKARWGE